MNRSTLSLTSAKNSVLSQRHATVALPTGKTRYSLYRRLFGPQGGSGGTRKISPPPLGMTGTKKVSDYLIDAKVSLPEKGRQFVFVNGSGGSGDPSDGGIIWLTGRRPDDRFKITPATENVLKITKEII